MATAILSIEELGGSIVGGLHVATIETEFSSLSLECSDTIETDG
jgi:hypothetical protein